MYESVSTIPLLSVPRRKHEGVWEQCFGSSMVPELQEDESDLGVTKTVLSAIFLQPISNRVQHSMHVCPDSLREKRQVFNCLLIGTRMALGSPMVSKAHRLLRC